MEADISRTLFIDNQSNPFLPNSLISILSTFSGWPQRVLKSANLIGTCNSSCKSLKNKTHFFRQVSLTRHAVHNYFSIHLSYSILASRKFHNSPGPKQMPDSNRLTLVLNYGKNINIAWAWTCIRKLRLFEGTPMHPNLSSIFALKAKIHSKRWNLIIYLPIKNTVSTLCVW